MKKTMIGVITGAMLFTMVSGTAVMAADITVDDAVDAALGKAGVAAADAAVYKKVWEFTDGREQYDVHFLIPGQTKFEYEVDAITGDILSGESDVWDAEDDFEYGGLKAGEAADPEESGKLEEAVLTAIKDAGLQEGQATVSKAGTDFENGKKIFDINFFVAGQTKYDYDIDAATGQIIAHEQEPWEADDDMEFKGLLNPGEAKAAPAATGELTEAEATAIAVKEAGFAESDVTVTKCVRDMDDGIEKYDISFRTADGVEYDYDIDVVNGTILERDMDYDDD